jgi:penicillin-binding protein 1C
VTAARRWRRAPAIAVCALAAAWLLIPRPELLPVSFSRAVFDRSGALLQLGLAADQRYRLAVDLDAVSPQLVAATLLHEDRHFWRHPGVNPVSLVRAAYHTFVTGDRTLGGSTLTMQLARLRFGIRSRTPAGKLVQIARALQLERHYGKRELLEAYLTLAPYGANIEGVAAAAWIYFGREPSDLTLDQALALAVLPQSPTRRSPQRDPAALRRARDALFERYAAEHPVAPAERAALALPLDFATRGDLPFRAPHFARHALRDVPDRARVFTTLDLGLQSDVETLLRAYVERSRRRGLANASALLVDLASLEVRAQVGSAAFFDAASLGQVDGTRAKRSPGSALKPFVYALALDAGLIHPRSMLEDTPQSFGSFNPENFDGDFRGPLPATTALVLSRNVPAVTLAARLGARDLHDLLVRAGVAGLRGRDFYGLAGVLGGVELSMQELVELYAMLGNGGVLRELRRTRHAGERAPVRLLGPEASLLALRMLATNPRPETALANRYVAPRVPVAWKTGTSHGFRDAWAVGLFGPYVLAVWVGNFDGRGDPALVGREAAGPLFFEIADAIAEREGIRESAWEANAGSLGLRRVEVCAISGGLPGPHCPHRARTWFIPGRSPIAACGIHRAVEVEVATGLRACAARPVATRTEVHEFWSSDLRRLFARAGLPRRLPPAFHPDCPLDPVAGHGIAPRITSPRADLVYSLRAGSDAPAQIAFSAVADGDARELYWFLDGRLLGRADSTAPFYWAAEPGLFTVRAVDGHGRSAALPIRVEVVQ